MAVNAKHDSRNHASVHQSNTETNEDWTVHFKIRTSMCKILKSATYLDLLNRVASDRVGQILLGVLKPGVEGRGLLSESEVEVLNLAVLLLEQQQLLPTSL